MKLFKGYKADKLVSQLLQQDDADENESAKALSKVASLGPAAIPALVAALDAASKNQTVGIVDVLSKLLSDKTLPAYIDGLKSQSRRVTSGVAWALTSDGKYDPNKLLELLGDPEIPKSTLVELLTYHKKRVNLRGLLNQAYSMETQDKIDVLQLVGEVATEDLVPELISRLSGKDPIVRMHLINVLARFPTPEVQMELQKYLTDKNKLVRGAVLDALTHMHSQLNIKGLCKLLQDPDIGVQNKAVDVIIKANHPDTVIHLIDALKDENEYARRSAVEVLNEIGDAKSIRHLLQAVQDEDWWVRARAADALAKIGGPRVTEAVLELIKDDDEDIRRAAVEILNSTRDERSLQHLIDALQDADWWVRERAVDALAEIGNKKAVPALVGMLANQNESIPVVLRALATLGDHKVIPDIAKQLGKTEKPIRLEAIKALAQLADLDRAATVKSTLEPFLKDADIDLRQAATDAIRAIDDRVESMRAVPRTTTQVAAAGAGVAEEGETLLVDASELDEKLAQAVEKKDSLDIATLQPGDMLQDRYKFVKRIGKGAFGTVILMEDTAVEEEIILKFLNPHIANDEEMMKRFVHELRYSRKITHPNVIRIFDLLNIDGLFAISMEYFPSHTLGQECANGGVPINKVLQIGIDIATGMAVAHEAGIVHRDLKPPNILIDDTGLVKIVDFGVAAAQASGDTQLTKTGYVIGSPKYMAPEQILGKKVTASADIYSVGVILYEMLTGTPPYTSGDHMAVMYQHVQGGARPVSEVNPKVPKPLSDLVAETMALEIKNRVSSMVELKQRLEDLME